MQSVSAPSSVSITDPLRWAQTSLYQGDHKWREKTALLGVCRRHTNLLTFLEAAHGSALYSGTPLQVLSLAFRLYPGLQFPLPTALFLACVPLSVLGINKVVSCWSFSNSPNNKFNTRQRKITNPTLQIERARKLLPDSVCLKFHSLRDFLMNGHVSPIDLCLIILFSLQPGLSSQQTSSPPNG